MTDPEPPTLSESGSIEVGPPDPEQQYGEDVVFQFNWTDDDGNVSAEGLISRGAGGLVISNIDVWTQYTGGVTHQILRAVPLGDILALARTSIALVDDAVSAHPIVVPPAKHTAMTDDLLRDVARAYLEESSEGKDRAVVARLEQLFGRPRGTITTWISRARKEGWLGPATRGRVGAEPGPKLVAWMNKIVGDLHDVTTMAREVAEAWGGATPGVVSQALRAYDDIAERDISHQMGLPPLQAAVASQVLYGRSLGAELEERTARANGDREAAFSKFSNDLRAEFKARAEAHYKEWVENQSGHS